LHDGNDGRGIIDPPRNDNQTPSGKGKRKELVTSSRTRHKVLLGPKSKGEISQRRQGENSSQDGRKEGTKNEGKYRAYVPEALPPLETVGSGTRRRNIGEKGA